MNVEKLKRIGAIPCNNFKHRIKIQKQLERNIEGVKILGIENNVLVYSYIEVNYC